LLGDEDASGQIVFFDSVTVAPLAVFPNERRGHCNVAGGRMMLIDGLGRPFDSRCGAGDHNDTMDGLSFLANVAPLEKISKYLLTFDSYGRTRAMAYLMTLAMEGSRCLWRFLDSGNACDSPWPWRSILASELRRARAKVDLIDLLGPEATAYFAALPEIVSVWRGCQRGRERGLSWTTDRTIAEGFASGKRCINSEPTLVSAKIQKWHIFAVFLDRKESEIVLDPRRLRNLRAEALTATDAHRGHARPPYNQPRATPLY
jgi:hypothetical protein